MNKLKIGFIGLGLMGSPMAKNILKAGYPLSVYNRSEKRLKDFKNLENVKVYHSPAELSGNVDVVISCVTGPEDVKQVYLGKNGVVEGVDPSTKRSGMIAIDMSTIGPSAAIEVGKGLKKAGVEFLDAPVTGGTTGAINGTLTIFIGGDEKIYQSIKGVFEAMGKDLQYMGKLGNGQAMKLINNLIVGITTEALAEGFLLGDSLGLKRQRVSEALQNVFSMSPGMKAKMPNMVSEKFPVSFSVANIRKDLKLAVDESGVPTSSRLRWARKSQMKGKINLPVGSIVEKLYKKGMDLGYSEKDLSAIIEILQKSA